jgi:hypothetical protein
MNIRFYMSILLVCCGVSSYAQSNIYGTTQVFPGGYFGVYNTITFSSGYLVTPRSEPSSNVYFTAGSASTGQSNASHVNGYAEKAGTTAFTFPVGDGTALRQVSISAPASAANFQAAYFKTNPNSATLPSGAPFPTANLGTGVTGISNVEYWDVNGSTSISLTLSWNAASNLNTLTGGSITSLRVVGYNPSTAKWENLGNAGGTTGTVSTTGTVTAAAVTPNTYSAFTFGTVTTIDLTPTNDIDGLNFVTAGTNRDFVVNVYNINIGPTTAPVRVAISKLTAFDITYSTSSGNSNVFGGTPNQNSDWTFTETSSFIIATSKSGIVINGNGQSVIGFTLTRKAGVANGTTQNITTSIASGTGGGETPTNNNTAITNVTAQ